MFDVVPFTHPKSRVDLALARLWATRTDQAAVHATGIARTHRRVGDVHAQFTAITATDLSADRALDALVALQQHIARLHALESDLLVRAAGATRVVREVLVEDHTPDGTPRPDRDPRIIELTDEVVDEIACALHRPVGVVQAQLHTARLLHGPLTRTLADLRAGHITAAHATAIADQASRLAAAPLGTDPDADLIHAAACDLLQDRVLAHAPTETVTECRARARRAVTTIDPAGAAARARRAKLHCDVTGRPLDDGLALIEAVLPALDAAAILARVDAHAHHAITTGTIDHYELGCDPTIGQIRAAVLAHLIRTGQLTTPDPTHPTGTSPPGTSPTGTTGNGATISVEVGVLIDAATLTGLTPNGPTWTHLNGHHADTTRDDLLTLLDTPGVNTRFRRLICDPTTGALIDHGANTYTATPALRAWLTARDQHCTQPGCTRPARRCDIDHALDYADGGRTTVANTRLMCRRHHNAKTHANWTTDDQDPDGSYTLTSPAGRQYRHEPMRLLPEPPPVPPPDPDPDPPPY